MVLSTITPDPDATTNIFDASPNFKDRYRVSYEYKTDIIISGTGTEQRRAVRNFPRRYLEFTSHHTRATKNHLDWIMARGLADEMVVPEYTRYVLLNLDLAPVETSPGQFDGWNVAPYIVTEGAAPPDWLKVGITVLFVDGHRIETRTVASVTDAVLQFSDESLASFPKGTRIYAGLFGHVISDPSSSRMTNDVAVLPTQFRVRPGSESFDETDPVEMVGTRELFTKTPNWAGGTRVGYIFPRDEVDYGYGSIWTARMYDWPSRTISADFVGRDHQDVKDVVDFFIRKRGRAREFFLPTWENDIPVQAIAGAGMSIIVDGAQFGITFKNSTVFKRIVLRMSDGRLLHFKVDFIEALTDTNSSVIWLTERLPVEEITGDSLIGISWVLVARFGSDRLDIDWLTDSVAQFSLSFVILENSDL